MRTIKFRGKSLNTRTWVYGDLQHKGKRAFVEYEIDPATVGQFTGLFDKNGKEIYEGDIVMWGHANDYSREFPYRQAVVKLFPSLLFETVTKTEFGTPHKFHYGNFSYQDTHKHLEIIGNIHDNPELLNPDSE